MSWFDHVASIRTVEDQYWRIHRQDCERLAGMSDEAVKKLWDAYDGCNCPSGISGEAIHSDLNRRGLGRYCAV